VQAATAASYQSRFGIEPAFYLLRNGTGPVEVG
jgi:hypothetical protein